MATWNNLDTLASYEKLAGLKNHVDIKEAMAGENGAERVAKYTAPMAEGLMLTEYGFTDIDVKAPDRTPEGIWIGFEAMQPVINP